MKPGDPAAVRELFEAIAPRYDLLNDSLSLGLHRLWKRQAVLRLQPRPGQRLLDLCCGTGDLALLLAERVRPGGLVLGIDKDEIPALSLRRELKQKAMVELYDKKLLTREEARAALQYGEMDPADAAALDAQDKAEIALKKAQTVKAYADTGLIGDEALAEAVTAALAADGTYPGLPEAVARFAVPADDMEDDIEQADPDTQDDETTGA